MLKKYYKSGKLIFKYFKKKIKTQLEIEKLKTRFNCFIDESCYFHIEDFKNVEIGDFCYFASHVSVQVLNENTTINNSFLSIGKSTFIGEYSDIRAAGGLIRIGNNCLIAQNVHIIAANHNFSVGDEISKNPWSQHKNFVEIMDGCWIGCNSIILPGVRIGKGAVVGAGSVVTKDIPENSIVAGNPAKLIKYRFENN